ncbi:hypothetical protein V1514DRAFT_323509 [Lipomyces japonicus]|uniref:uncharacterized protein n=1 Tax=Lipomyces japonicus TaxID=56871 RepID=UPI0034CDC618
MVFSLTLQTARQATSVIRQHVGVAGMTRPVKSPVVRTTCALYLLRSLANAANTASQPKKQTEGKNAKLTSTKSSESAEKEKTATVPKLARRAVPRFPRTTWAFFLAEQLRNSKKEKFADNIRLASVKFNELSATDKKHYEKQAHEDVARYNKEIKDFFTKTSIESINLYNENPKKISLKDPNRPKRGPYSAYGLFLVSLKGNTELEGLDFTERSHRSKKLYEDLSQSAKDELKAQADTGRAKYLQEFIEYKASRTFDSN